MEKKCNDITFVNNYKRVLLKKIKNKLFII